MKNIMTQNAIEVQFYWGWGGGETQKGKETQPNG